MASRSAGPIRSARQGRSAALGRADPQRSVTPQAVPGTVTRVDVSGDKIAFRPDGSAATEGFAVICPDRAGNGPRRAPYALGRKQIPA